MQAKAEKRRTIKKSCSTLLEETPEIASFTPKLLNTYIKSVRSNLQNLKNSSEAPI
jgi:hypothetical protein